MTGAAPHPDGETRSAPSRRVMLALAGSSGLLALTPALTGCTTGTIADVSPTPRPPSPDEAARAGAARTTATLLALTEALGDRDPDLAGVCSRIAGRYRDHLAAIRAAGLPSTSPPASAPPSGGVSARRVVEAGRDAAREALAQLADAGDDTARLLGRLAAARAVHSDLLARAAGLSAPGQISVPSPGATGPEGATSAPELSGPSLETAPATSAAGSAPTAAAPEALIRRLAGQHAAVYAYGLVTARIDDARRQRARQYWDLHVRSRDDLEALLRGLRVTLPSAPPGYAVEPPASASAAAALAARVEDGVAALAEAALPGLPPDLRLDSATALVAAARRAARWRSLTGALIPGRATPTTS